MYRELHIPMNRDLTAAAGWDARAHADLLAGWRTSTRVRARARGLSMVVSRTARWRAVQCHRRTVGLGVGVCLCGVKSPGRLQPGVIELILPVQRPWPILMGPESRLGGLVLLA